MQLLIIWAVFAVAGYFVAQSKNRNSVGWAVLCFLFGIFALVPLLCVKALPASKEDYVVVNKTDDTK